MLGTVTSDALAEISGVAASRTSPGVLYVHNDSGEPHARFFAIRTDGTLLGEYALGDEPVVDVEDIAIGPGRTPGTTAVYLGDVGDNAARELQAPASRGAPSRWTPRASIAVLRVSEPTVPRDAQEPVQRQLSDVERFELRYAGEPYDCEAFFVDAAGDLYLLAKVASGPAPVFRARAPLSTRSPTILERVGETAPARDLGDAITAASLDSMGLRLAVRTYRAALLYVRRSDQSWVDVLAASPLVLPRLREPQGEALGWLDGATLVSITEGPRSPIQALRDGCARGAAAE
ncbi:MAG: hypothetical protein OHK0013_28630 [Sandaracinaceae bacterium]